MNVLSDGMGSWGYRITDPLLKITFPNLEITHDNSKAPDLVVRSHFVHTERRKFDCPYISWSGESYHVPKTADEPLCEINTFDCDQIYYPLIASELSIANEVAIKNCAPKTLIPADQKKFFCAYAYSNRVKSREDLFNELKVFPTVFSFGSSCYMHEKPFNLSRDNRYENARAFKDFGFLFAMENVVKPGYITEKIGMAYESGCVPIYDSRNGVDRFFNRESFVDSQEKPETIYEIWQDKQKLQKILDAPQRLNDNLAQYEDMTSYKTWMKPFVDSLKDGFPDH